MKRTALIADDEQIQREALRQALARQWPELELVAECTNGIDAWDAFLEHEPDILFLDIRMPGQDGLEVARRVGARAQIVFITAYGEHALAAFDTGAVDYLVKPLEPARLSAALERLRTRGPALSTEALAAQLDRLASAIGARPTRRLEVLQASVGREIRLIPVEDVIYFESDARYTRVVHRAPDGSAAEVLIRTALKELLPQLDPERFWQIHRSTIVAVREVSRVEREDDRMWALLRNRPERLAVSRHFQGLFRPQ
jgi:DNA-binding LytR/AlgR family response regulator